MATDNTYQLGISLADVKIIPGVVLSHDDPKKMQRVKAFVPGLFDPKTMSTEAMPWIYPLCMNGFQSFSLQNNNTKIWVIILPDNPYGYFYLPFFELFPFTKAKVIDETDILMSRQTSLGEASIYYNGNDGIMAKLGDSIMNLRPDGKAVLQSSGTDITLNNGQIHVGSSEEDGEPMVMGDQLTTLLNNLKSGLQGVAAKAMGHPITMPVGQELMNVVTTLSNDINNIKSGTCHLTK